MSSSFSGAFRADVFPEIWTALTTDRLLPLLDTLNPRPRGRHVLLTCPACGMPEAYLYESKDGKGPRIHCNRKNNCGHDQSLWEYVKAQHGGDAKAAMSALADSAGIRLDNPQEAFPRRKRVGTREIDTKRFSGPPNASEGHVDIPEGLPAKQEQYAAALADSPAESFLRDRGLASQAAESMGFGFCASWPREGSARLTYPLTDRAGQIVAIEGRLLPPDEVAGRGGAGGRHGPKCLCDGPKGEGVFSPRPLRLDDLHLCEGPMDAACLSFLGFEAVAVCGTAVPEWLLKACAFREVWIAFDADRAGDKAAETAEAALNRRGVLTHRLRPVIEGADWGEGLSLPMPELRDALWLAQGVPETLRVLRREYGKLRGMLEYLQTHERTALHDRQALVGRVGEGIEAFAWLCDLPDGYRDPSDPFASDALLTLRHLESEAKGRTG